VRRIVLTATLLTLMVGSGALSPLAQAEIPKILRSGSGTIPFVQVEEYVPGASSVSADFYAKLLDFVQPKPTTVRLQYVESADYEPTAANPYAGGVTVSVATTSETEPELHAHLALEPDVIYHYRAVAFNSDGRFETSDQTVTTYPASQGVLPDGRGYEQVSPADKNNVDALGNGNGMTMQASPSGSAFAFFSFEPFPVAVGTNAATTDYLSSRTSAPAAWSTQGVQPLMDPASNRYNEVRGFTGDLGRTIVQVYGPPLGSPGVINAYVRDNTTGSYQLLAAGVEAEAILFVDSSRDDSRILFETEHQLLPAARVGKTNLYEWDEAKPVGQRLSLVGILPDAECATLGEPSGCAPSNGSGAGAAGSENQGFEKQEYLQNTISEDGSKIFFTAHGGTSGGRIYERDPEAEPAVTVPVSAGAATFLAATPSGRYVFYAEGTELYRFDTTTDVRQALTSGAEGVIGNLGASDDGSYIYFTAGGVLASNENAHGEEAIQGAPNLYEWHEDPVAHAADIKFIARLISEQGGGDQRDWAVAEEGDEGRTSRLTTTGKSLLFMSHAPLTGYDNGHLGSSACRNGKTLIPCQELFLYDAARPLSSVNPVCVSCNPSVAVAAAPAGLDQGESEVALTGPTWSSHPTRNLSADGNRVFFETAESLVPSDTNGVTDVYEWEREGTGSCPSGNGHCVYLISTGTAHAKSFFGDASTSGEDVFFFTRQPLVGQDRDLNFDVYDARVGGGIAAQTPPVNQCEGEDCKPAALSPPEPGVASSTTLAGPGNLLPQAPAVTVAPKKPAKKATKCAKGRKRGAARKLSHGRCVKSKKGTKAKKGARSHQRGSR
jgi:hypothetical protein